ncbi:hypothetical protein AB0O68_15425 [Streptomyces sp. NPDC087512]|uniref:hypothetical protein n=1 Tax=Streptomyces sp. NPDC087512 TaxID=3155059 RepID=UPI00343B8267
MTIESTLPSIDYDPRPWERRTLADQRAAFAAMDRIIELHPELPGAYITLSVVVPGLVDVQAQTFAAFEAWREALDVRPEDVQPGNCAPEREHIEFQTEVDGVPVRVYVMGDLVQPAVSEDSAVAA